MEGGQGTVGAMFLSLDRLNWYSPDGIHLVDDFVVARAIDKFPSTLWKILLEEGFSEAMEKSLAPKLATPRSNAREFASTLSRKFQEAAARRKREPSSSSPTPATPCGPKRERCLLNTWLLTRPKSKQPATTS